MGGTFITLDITQLNRECSLGKVDLSKTFGRNTQ